MKVTDKYIFFYKEFLSQWHRSDFYDPDTQIIFPTCEKYMMFYKAKLFGDEESAKKILLAKHPKEDQDLGRLVKGYNQEIWNREKQYIVYNANYLKFSQNPELLKKLLSFDENLQFVEASPIDKIWGIGMVENDFGIENKDNWKGENLLGIAITEVRNSLLDHLRQNLNYYNFRDPF